MKRFISVFMVGVMVFLMTACASKASFEGEWKAVSIDTAGHKVSDSEQAMIDKMLESFEINIKSDGTAVFIRLDKSSPMNATWKSEGDNITFDTDEEDTVKGELKDGKLILDMDGEGKMIFEKK